MPITKLFGGVLQLLLVVQVSSATYFISTGGDDANPGTSTEKPWKTLGRLEQVKLVSGDRILLAGGQTFQGRVQIIAEKAESPLESIEVSSFGNGRPTIAAGVETAIRILNVEQLTIRNLVLAGAGPTNNLGSGILVENSRTNQMLKGVLIDAVEASGFGQHGILVTGQSWGYEDVLIQRCSLSRNRKGGLEVAGKLPWDSTQYAHKNVIISECRAFENPGDPNYTQNHSGSGIVLYQVDGGRIEKSAAWNNGELCPAAGGGPVGIWTCASRHVVIEYCESFSNRTQGLDGGGFDIDGGSESCILQYNYSHDNEGPGLMVYTYPYASNRDRRNIVRFNISVNDAVDSERYGGLWVRADGKKMEGLDIYNNTVITRGPHAAYVHADGIEISLRNNIFISSAAGVPLRVDALNQLSGFKLDHNVFWRSGGAPLLRMTGQNVTNPAELSALLGAGGTSTAGLFLNPEISHDSTQNLEPLPNLRVLNQFKPKTKFAGITSAPIPDLSHDILGASIRAAESLVGAVAATGQSN